MKITKYGDTPDKSFEEYRKEANKGCQTCPCCSAQRIQRSAYRAVSDECRVDCYRCNHCGAEWESDVYPYRNCSSDDKYKDDQFKDALTSLTISGAEIKENSTLIIYWSAISTPYRGKIIIRNTTSHALLDYEIHGIPIKYHEALLKIVWNQLGNMLRPTGSSII